MRATLPCKHQTMIGMGRHS